MAQDHSCSICGADLPQDAMSGLCASCLQAIRKADDRCEHSQKVKRLFQAAKQLTTPAQRAAFFQAACGDDVQLRQRLEDLLRADEQATEAKEAADMGSAYTRALPAGMPEATEKAGDHIGHYKLLQKIGEGGWGVVYMAEQEKPVKRRVALKVIKLGMDTRQVIARFEAERQALALMDHPNIAKVLDAGATDTGRPYFVMELVKGIRITDYCDQNNLSTPERLNLFMQVCCGALSCSAEPETRRCWNDSGRRLVVDGNILS